MGFFDVLKGKSKLRQPTDDRLFAMSTAYITMDTQGLHPVGRAAIVFQPLGTADFDAIVTEMTELLHATGEENDTTIESRDDAFGYRFMVLGDTDFEDLVVGLNAVSSALRDGGYGDRILAALFPFEDDQGKRVHWIYNFKRATFYPMVPGPGKQTRDNERELRLKAQMGTDLPIEQDLGRWFPLWDVPL